MKDALLLGFMQLHIKLSTNINRGNSSPYSSFTFLIDPIQPIFKYIGTINWRGYYTEDVAPNKMCKMT
jgi:hypothetical protein